IPNRTVKRLCADDSAATSVKVGYRQASNSEKARASGLFHFQVSSRGHAACVSCGFLLLLRTAA
ncbi:MAG: hypothetical protein K2X55_28190, partial [Burkholderiaceae bacterium]|nr:hypothetical protein [Burkholderiaceae bacterium]